MSTRALLILLSTFVVLLTTATSMGAAATGPSASRVIDKTFVCATELRGGIREIEVQAGRTQQSKGFALFDVSTHWVPDYILAGVGDNVVDWNPRRCKDARVAVPLKADGLTRIPPWGHSGVEVDCATPREVVLRVRGVFRAPVTPRRASSASRGGFRVLVARGVLVEGYLAVRTRTGRPLAYAFVNRKRQARLFTASTCYPD